MSETLNIVIHICLFICGCYLWWKFFRKEWLILTKKWWNLQEQFPLGDVSGWIFHSLVPVLPNFLYVLGKVFFE